MTYVAKEKSEICHISFTFPITVANENANLAGALKSYHVNCIKSNPEEASHQHHQLYIGRRKAVDV
jgi:hypothetical protein